MTMCLLALAYQPRKQSQEVRNTEDVQLSVAFLRALHEVCQGLSAA